MGVNNTNSLYNFDKLGSDSDTYIYFLLRGHYPGQASSEESKESKETSDIKNSSMNNSDGSVKYDGDVSDGDNAFTI
eukprot:4618588-Ditylum_brightwellii.AAC.1